MDYEQGSDGQQFKEMEASVKVDSGIVTDDFGVFMRAKELSKGKDTSDMMIIGPW